MAKRLASSARLRADVQEIQKADVEQAAHTPVFRPTSLPEWWFMPLYTDCKDRHFCTQPD